MTNSVRNKYRPRKNTPKSERRREHLIAKSDMFERRYYLHIAGFLRIPSLLEKGLGHKLRGRKP